MEALHPNGGSSVEIRKKIDEFRDLVSKMICLDHEKRSSAGHSLRHLFVRTHVGGSGGGASASSGKKKISKE